MNTSSNETSSRVAILAAPKLKRAKSASAEAVPTAESGLDSCCRRLTIRSSVAAAAMRKAARDQLRTLTDGEYLARRGEDAAATWIIERGEIDVGKPRLKVRRRGEIVGEAGLLNKSKRSTDLVASGPARVWCISREALDALLPEERAAVYEALAGSLLEKLEQAVDERHEQRSELGETEALLKAFVPSSGLSFIRARLFDNRTAGGIHRKVNAVVWFSDIAGFSKLTKEMTAEDAGAAAIALQSPIISAIEANQGEIDKLMGDGAMAFWLAQGNGIPNEVAAAAVDAAIKAARDVRAAALAQGWKHIQIRIGLHCGEVLIGDFGSAGRRSFTLIGPVVNAAARYEQVRETETGKPLGPIRISPELFARLPDARKELFERKVHRFHEKSAPALGMHRLRPSIIGELK